MRTPEGSRERSAREQALVVAWVLLLLVPVGALAVASSSGRAERGQPSRTAGLRAAETATGAREPALDDVSRDRGAAPRQDVGVATGDLPREDTDAGDQRAEAPPPAVLQPGVDDDAGSPAIAEVTAAGDTAAGPRDRDDARRRFRHRFPEQARARQDKDRNPATAYWAVLVGVNEHQGRVRDNVGSRQDAEDLYRHLRGLGWLHDHIVVLRDADATRENIEQAMAWLARKTDHRSVAVFHYSGHVKRWHGRDVDGDGEIPDEGLWPSDNRHIPDREFVVRMDRVDAGWLWVNIGGCHAAGLNDPGLRREGRLLTFSSQEAEKSYEDPPRENSVWGWFMIDRGMIAGEADRDGDGDVTAEEAFAYARPSAARRTEGGSHGPQRAVVYDDNGRGELSLRPPPPRRTEPDRSPGSGGGGGGDCGLPVCP